MHAFIIVGNLDKHDEYIEKQVNQANFAKLPFEIEGIEDVRKLISFTKLSFSQKTAIIIKNIDEISLDAQNALLKSIEEPQENIIYILTAKQENSMLPTILSRCEIVRIQIENNPQYIENFEKFSEMNTSQKLGYLSKITDRQTAIDTLEQYLQGAHTNFSEYEKKSNFLTHTQKCIENLKANGNVALQLTNYAVELSK